MTASKPESSETVGRTTTQARQAPAAVQRAQHSPTCAGLYRTHALPSLHSTLIRSLRAVPSTRWHGAARVRHSTATTSREEAFSRTVASWKVPPGTSIPSGRVLQDIEGSGPVRSQLPLYSAALPAGRSRMPSSASVPSAA